MFEQFVRYLQAIGRESRFPDLFFAAVVLGAAAMIVLILQ
jgi:hypothetical protein